MEAILKERRILMKNKTYKYLYVPVSRAILESMSPNFVVIKFDNCLPIRVKIRRWTNRHGYAIIPRDIVKYLGLQQNQVVEIEFE
jgi:hypothetical protein